MKNKILTIYAKCSDRCYLYLYDEYDKQLGNTYNGYVPNWLPNKNTPHGGDYIQLEIDLETGQILNWVKPTITDLKKTFDYPVIKNQSKPTVRPSTQYTKNIIPKGGVKIKDKIYNNVNDILDNKYANASHIKLKRDASGRFIKMDTIAEFDYPHNGELQFRVVKVVKETDKYIEGIQCNSGNTGYKRFNVTKASGVYKYKGYVKDLV